METGTKGSRSRLRGPAQLELFPREVLEQCGGQQPPLRTSHGHAVVQNLMRDDGPSEEGADVFQLVAVWHDRAWEPVRVFRRGDGASVVVFRVA